MTTTLERPEITHRPDRPMEAEPPRPRRGKLFALIAALALLAGGIVLVITSGSDTDGLTKGQIAYGQRLEQMAANYTPPALTQGQMAEADRWTEQARSLGAMLTPAQQAEAARWEARAAAELGLTPGQQVAADRYQGLANDLTRGRRAETERWQAIAESYE